MDNKFGLMMVLEEKSRDHLKFTFLLWRLTFQTNVNLQVEVSSSGNLECNEIFRQ